MLYDYVLSERYMMTEKLIIMFCSKCGNQIPDGSQFCSACGANLSNPSSFKAEEQQNLNRETSAYTMALVAKFSGPFGWRVLFPKESHDWILSSFKELDADTSTRILNYTFANPIFFDIFLTPALTIIPICGLMVMDEGKNNFVDKHILGGIIIFIGIILVLWGVKYRMDMPKKNLKKMEELLGKKFSKI